MFKKFKMQHDQCPISLKKKKKLLDEHNTDVCRSTKVLVMKIECFGSGVHPTF